VHVCSFCDIGIATVGYVRESRRNAYCTVSQLVTGEELRQRATEFAIRVVLFVRTLPTTTDAQEIGRQLLRSALSVSANYRATCRARSRREFVAKLGIVLEEADEAEHWLQMLDSCDVRRSPELTSLKDEAGQLRAIFRQSVATARRNHANFPKSINS
jgi:four helix bundle protein